MFGKRVRHMNRYRDIAIALIRNGFGFIVEEIDVFHMLSLPARIMKHADKVPKLSLWERIGNVIQDLGPTFIKLGQIGSTRSDVFPEELIKQLEKLQDQVEAFPFSDVEHIIEAESGFKMDEIFEEFRQIPTAAASIGQVHEGKLISGERVAVKIQRPDIAEMVKTDLEILRNLAAIMENHFDWAKKYQILKMVEEFGKSLLDELDYKMEGRNTELIAGQFKNDPNIYIPGVYWSYSSTRVLVMEFVEGIKVSDIEQLKTKNYNTKIIAERFVQSILHQVFIEGFFHADPHPGNLLVLPGEVVAFIDFGMVGRLTPEMKLHFSNLIIGLMRKKTDVIIKSLLDMGIVTEHVNKAELRQDVNQMRDKYYGVALSEVSLGESVQDLFDIAYRHQIRIPSDLILLGKTLLTMEGIVEKLDPEISIIQIAEPIGKRLFKERFHPKNIGERFWKDVADYGEILVEFPKHIKGLLQTVNNGNLKLEVSVSGIEVILKKLDRISNRLSISLVLLSFSIIMLGLIIGSSISHQSSMLWDIPAIEIGFIIAGFLFMWLLYSIFKSGRF
ncbi:ABC1 kinase family protein [Paenibacillus nasutitermitis]|uniref:ABC transporter n=1 Tax=Paenibacillus nasutitermitis TaxID=1652958 RepID=A0A917DRN5_9BACL|nr:AarF/ABC1/UbiB kinase family protein [Paenibacillus nasutitermitis]GGD64528.1 ABC transporter [Paenibacillus nasutitermitis]